MPKDDQIARAREAVRRMARNAPQLFSKEISRKFYRVRMEVAEVDTLVALAREGDRDALEILRKHARGADSELAILMTAAQPLHPKHRAEFLRAVAAELAKHPETGDGLVARVARDLQRRYLNAPPVNGRPHAGKYG